VKVSLSGGKLSKGDAVGFGAAGGWSSKKGFGGDLSVSGKIPGTSDQMGGKVTGKDRIGKTNVKVGLPFHFGQIMFFNVETSRCVNAMRR